MTESIVDLNGAKHDHPLAHVMRSYCPDTLLLGK